MLKLFKKKYALNIIFMILFLLSTFIWQPVDGPVVQIVYDGNSHSLAQVFWGSDSEGICDKNSVVTEIQNNLADLKLPIDSYFIDKFRIDFTNLDKEVIIVKINFYRDDELYDSIDGKDLPAYILSDGNILDYSIAENKLVIVPENDDPMVKMDNAFVDKVKAGYEFGYTRFNLYAELFIVFCYLLILYVRSGKKYLRKLWEKIYQAYENDTLLVFILYAIVFSGITFIIYHKYLLGEYVYLFNSDIASDSFYQTFPDLVSTARTITAKAFGEHWNFNESLGNLSGLVYPTLNNWVAFFGINNVAFLMGVSQFMKVLLAGFLFYCFLRTMGNSRKTSSLFSIFYAYCGHMMSRGAWQAYPNEVVLMALWLIGFERFYTKKDKKWLPIVTAVFFLNFSGYYTILYTGIFLVYGIFRYYSDHSLKEINFGVIREHICFGLSIIIGWLISGVSSIASLSLMLNSNRLANSINGFNNTSFFSNALILKTAYLRMLGTDILGVNHDYVGNENILGAPAFYCGILSLILIPVAFKCFDKRKRIWYGIGFFAAFMYILVSPLRILVNGFASATFKLSSFWIIIFLLLTAVQGMEFLIKEKGKVKLYFIIVPVIMILGMCVSYISGLYIRTFIISVSLILIYSTIIVLLNRKLRYTTASLVLMVIVLIETVCLSYRIVNDRGVISNEDLNKKILYNDYSNEAVAYLNDREDRFYRIDKDYNSVFLCDSLYQGYNGTKGYIGSTGDRNLTGDFYLSLGFPIYKDNHYAHGFEQSTQINTLLNVKYLLSRHTEVSNFDYDQIYQVGDVYIYENRNALPLGSGYNKYILREDFEKLTIAQKRNVIMKACIVEDDSLVEGLSKLSKYDCGDALDNIENKEIYQTEYHVEKEGNQFIITFEPTDETEVAVLKLRVNNNDRISCVGNNYSPWGDEIVFNSADGTHRLRSTFVLGENEYIYDFSTCGVHEVIFTVSDQINIDNLEVYVMPKSVYYQEYNGMVDELKGVSLEGATYMLNEFNGTYNINSKEQILFFAIPYDENWHIYVDGEERQIIQSNIGFIGTVVSNGEHEVILKYVNDNKYVWFMIGGIVVYLLYLVGLYYEKKYIIKKTEEKNEKNISGCAGI